MAPAHRSPSVPEESRPNCLPERTAATAAAQVGWIAAPRSDWIELTSLLGSGVPSVCFLFETQPELGGRGVEARFEVATAANEAAIVRTITEHDPGNVIALRLPAHPARDRKCLLSIREDTERRLAEVRALNLPDGPLPRRIWCLTGFRSNGQFYTDPAIAQMDFDIIRMLGLNGFWEQNGGQPGDLRKLAASHGLDRSTVYWRSVETPPREPRLNGAVPLKWDSLEQ